MKPFSAAIHVEYLKTRRSKVFLYSILFFIFIGMVMGLLLYASSHPEFANRSATLQMKTSFLTGGDWNAFYALMLQIILTLGMIGPGVITAWCFGREYSDGVLKDLLALPVPRSMIVVAKLVIVFSWSMILSAVILLAASLTGWAIGLESWDPAAFAHFLGVFFLCALLNALLLPVVAFVASAGKGYILPITFVILVLILTQLVFIGIPGLSPWFPFALPALISGVAGDAAPSARGISYLLYGLSVVAGAAGTIYWWRFADHK